MGPVLPDLREGSVVDVEAAYVGGPVVREARDEAFNLRAGSEAHPWSLRARAGVPGHQHFMVGGTHDYKFVAA